MKNETLKAAARKILKELLAQCTPSEQYMFKRMYGKLSDKIEKVVDDMEPDRMDWAITQVERTIKNKEQKV